MEAIKLSADQIIANLGQECTHYLVELAKSRALNDAYAAEVRRLEAIIAEHEKD